MEEVKKKRLPGLTSTLAITATLYHVLYISGILSRLGIHLVTIKHLAVSLAFMLVLTFLIHPMKGRVRDKLPWYDILFASVGLLGSAYLYFDWQAISANGTATTLQAVIGLLTILVLLEATRRLIGMAMPLICLFFLGHVFFCNYFPSFMHGRGYSLERGIGFVFYTISGLPGLPLNVAATVVIIFLLFSEFLETSGAGKFFLDISFALFGRVRGGPAKAAVVGSAFMGSISGSVTTNIVTTGSFTIPMMKQVGYRPHFAGAVEAVSSTGGALMPPVMGAVAFVAAEFLNVPYLSICVAAALPAVLYYLAEFLIVDLEAVKDNLKGFARADLPSAGRAMKEGWQYLVPLIALIFLLVILKYEAETAGLYSIVVLILVSMFSKEGRIGPRRFLKALERGMKSMLFIGITSATAGVLIGCITLTGLGDNLSYVLIDLSYGKTLLLLVFSAIASIILGMGLTATACYLVLATLVAPTLIQGGILPIAAHLFILYFGLASFITPPVAIGAYVAAGVAGSDPIKTGYAACRIGIVCFILPFMFVYNPALLMIGSLGEVVLTSVSAIFGTLGLSVGASGFMLKRLKWWERIMSIAGGIMVIVPAWETRVIGVGLLGLVAFLQLKGSQVLRAGTIFKKWSVSSCFKERQD